MKKIIWLVLVLMFPVTWGCVDKERVNESARAFTSRIPDATGFQCMYRDSDTDGYVTCSVFRKDKDPLAIECTYYGSGGCKVKSVFK